MSPKILLVDKSPAIKQAFTVALKGYDYSLKATDKPQLALELINSFQPHLIFVDSLIQNTQTAEFIQKCHTFIKSPIILLKNNFSENTEAMQKLLQKKVIHSVLEKPFKRQFLREIIHKCIYQESFEESLEEDLDTPVTLDPIVKWENTQDEDPAVALTYTQDEEDSVKKNADSQKINNNIKNNTKKKIAKKIKRLDETNQSIEEIILEQLHFFFKDQSKNILKEVATPIVQDYVQEQVKLLAKNLIEKEIQKMLNQEDLPSKKGLL